jgi:hypothetical protein
MVSCMVKSLRDEAEGKPSAKCAKLVAGRRPEANVIYPWPGGSSGNTLWTPEPLYVEKCLDELWVGVKGQSNLVIACSLRNIFRYGLMQVVTGGRALDRLRSLYQLTDANQTPNTGVQ